MLNILYIKAATAYDGPYRNVIDKFIERYKILGPLTACVSHTPDWNGPQMFVRPDGVTITFVEKENTVKKRFFARSENKKKVYGLVEKADIVIGHVPDSVASMALLRACKLKKTCIAVVVGCAWDALWNYGWKGKLMAPISFFNMRRTLREVPHAIYVTERFLQHRYPCPGETLACSNVELMPFDESVLSRRLGKIESEPQKTSVKIVTTATIDVPFKNQEDVIAAMSELKKRGAGKEIHYYLIGPGDKTRLASVARHYGLENNVHFLGKKSHEDVFAILDSADIYVQPSRLEGLPRAVVEAMGRALPVIGTRVGGIPELLPVSRLYAPGDVRSLARIIESLTPEVMAGDARRNFAKAGEYASDVLNARRNAFLEHVAQYAAAMKDGGHSGEA